MRVVLRQSGIIGIRCKWLNVLLQRTFISQDVLAKIRECGSSVTYYGGRVVDNKSPEVSPMTKAIMQEIRGDQSMCGSCQPRKCPRPGDVFPPTNAHGIDDSMSMSQTSYE